MSLTRARDFRPGPFLFCAWLVESSDDPPRTTCADFEGYCCWVLQARAAGRYSWYVLPVPTADRYGGSFFPRDCPVGLAALRRRARLAGARLVALLGILWTGLLSGCEFRDSTRVPGIEQGEPTVPGCELQWMGEMIQKPQRMLGKVLPIQKPAEPPCSDCESVSGDDQ